MSAKFDRLVKGFSDAIRTPKTKTTPYDTVATVTRTDGDTVYVHIPGGVDETPVSKTMDCKSGDKVQVRVSGGRAWVTGNATAPPTDDKKANQALTEVNEVEQNVTILNNVVTENIEATNARFGYVEADTAKIHSLTADQLSATVGYIDDLTAGNITASDIVADHGTIDNLDANYAHISNGFIDNADIKEANVENLTSKYAHITQGVIDNATIGYADVNGLSANYAQINLANVNNAWIENGVVKDAAISDAQIIGVSANKLTAGTIDASEINVANLRAKNLIVEKMNGQPILGGYELVNKNSTGYSGKNPSNEGWYEYSNGTFVASTDTTVNMSKAYYKDGTQVALYDQTYIDGLENNLQQQIDGAIETFTGSVVPTLVNYPAVDWTSAQMANHVGDIYYVVNSSSQQNGYCYRFAYDNTTSSYKWELIKDSDVTAALSRLQTAEGDITNLKSFESETTGWITETDEELGSLKTRTTNLETGLDDAIVDVKTLWYTKADNSTPIPPNTKVEDYKYILDKDGYNIVDKNGNAFIMSEAGSDIWTVSVPTYSADTPHYFYCFQYEYADGTVAWSDVVYDIATSENQANARNALATLETKVSTTVFNEVKQTVDENSATITSLSEVVETKADGSTVDTLSNTANVISQIADTNSSTISNLTTVLGTNADGSTKEGDISHRASSLKQDLDGFKTTVSSTYQTKSDMSNYSTTTQMTSAINQKASEISSAVSQTYATIASVPTNVSDLNNDSNFATESYADGVASDAETNAKTDADKKFKANFATSSTVAGTAAKVATITPEVTGWSLYNGATIVVKFINANTTSAPTLNINSTGAKSIKTYSGGNLSADEYKWVAGATMTFTYDGTNWRIQDSSELVRLKSAESSITQTADSIISLVANTDTYTKPDGTTATNTIKSAIKQNAEDIALRVEKSGVIAAIRLSSESAKIQASKVEIDGTAIFNAISSDVDDAITDKGYQTATDVSATISNTSVSDLSDGSTYAKKSDALGAVTTKDQYYLSTSSSSATGGSWQDTVPTWSANKYIWIRVATTKTPVSGSASTSYAPSENGMYDSALTSALSTASSAQSSANSAASTVVTTKQYYLSTSTSSATGGSWGDSVPTWSSGKYIWVRFKIVKTPVSGTATTTYSPSESGVYDSTVTTALSTAYTANAGLTDKADKTAAVAETQRIYYRSSSSTKPNGNGLPTAWVTDTVDKYNSNATTSTTSTTGWTRKVTPISNGTGSSVTKYLYLWTCIQKKTVSGTVTYGDILLDDSTTVIDGGKIITGSVSANSINASSGTFDVANIPDLSADKILAGTLTIGKVDGLNDALSNKANSSDVYDLSIITTYSASTITFLASLYMEGEDATTNYDTNNYHWYFKSNDVLEYINSGYSVSVNKSDINYGKTIYLDFIKTEYMNALDKDGNQLLDKDGNALIFKAEVA